MINPFNSRLSSRKLRNSPMTCGRAPASSPASTIPAYSCGNARPRSRIKSESLRPSCKPRRRSVTVCCNTGFSCASPTMPNAFSSGMFASSNGTRRSVNSTTSSFGPNSFPLLCAVFAPSPRNSRGIRPRRCTRRVASVCESPSISSSLMLPAASLTLNLNNGISH